MAEEKAGRLPTLLLEAERVANAVAFGIHGRRRVGQGETFWQFRPYSQGDPRNVIDWRKSARGASNEHLYVRENEWEAAQTVYIDVQRSASMTYQTSTAHHSKQDAALILGLALTLMLVRAGERVGTTTPSSQPATGRAAFDRIAEEWLLSDSPKQQ